MRRVVIFGATSAIAAEVAAIYAARGDALHLVGRSAVKLAALERRLEAAASVRPQVSQADFDELHANGGLVDRVLAELGGADVALIAHGVLGDQLATEADFAAAERSIRTNFTSAISLLVPLANYFETQRGGRLGVITSVAGERGRPRNYTYGACKGALNIYLQGVRSRLRPAGVRVTTLKLGPVDTPMTEGHEKNRLFAQPAAVARSIVDDLDHGRDETFVPRKWGAIMPVVRQTPEFVFQRLRFLSGR